MARWIGNYGVIEELSKDEFGTLYRARNPILDLEVVLKIMQPSFLINNRFIANLRQEAQLASDLEHPNLVPVHDFGEVQGCVYLVHKYMPGGSLKDLLAIKGNPDEQTALMILDQVGKGLDYAHANGLVHHDLNPKKILFDSDGVPRLVGVGFSKTIATARNTAHSGPVSKGSSFAYTAPELWLGTAASSEADIYSMGCILYEMLTGSALFTAQTLPELVEKHVSAMPQISAALPVDIKNILLKAVAREPQDRYQSMADFSAALMRCAKTFQTGKTGIGESFTINSNDNIPVVTLPITQGRMNNVHQSGLSPEIPASALPNGNQPALSSVPKRWYAGLEETAKESYEVEQEFQKRKIPNWVFLTAIAGVLVLVFSVLTIAGSFGRVFRLRPPGFTLPATFTPNEIPATPFPSETAFIPTATRPPAPATPTPFAVVVLPSETPTLVVDKGKLNNNANCRAKPGTQFFIIKVLKDQTEVIINGVNEDKSWVNVKIDSETHAYITWDNCWISARNIDFYEPALTRPFLTPITIAKYRLEITLVGNKPSNVENQYVEGTYFSYREAFLKGEQECKWWLDNWNNQCTATIVTLYE